MWRRRFQRRGCPRHPLAIFPRFWGKWRGGRGVMFHYPSGHCSDIRPRSSSTFKINTSITSPTCMGAGRHLAAVQQPVLLDADIDKCAKVDHVAHGAFQHAFPEPGLPSTARRCAGSAQACPGAGRAPGAPAARRYLSGWARPAPARPPASLTGCFSTQALQRLLALFGRGVCAVTARPVSTPLPRWRSSPGWMALASSGFSPPRMRRNPADCSKALGPSPGTLRSASRLAKAHFRRGRPRSFPPAWVRCRTHRSAAPARRY